MPVDARRIMPARTRCHAALRAFTALVEMSRERASEAEWRDLADSMNIVEALVDLGKLNAVDVAPILTDAKDGLIIATKCADGQMRVGRDQLLALRKVVTLHDEAMGRFSSETMFKAKCMVVAVRQRVLAGDEEGVTVVTR